MATTREGGNRLVRFFAPISIGDETWWAMTALGESDKNKTIIQMILIMLIISLISLGVILGVLVSTLRKKLKPIGGIVSAAEQISSVIQNNSASAEETSATSEELSAQADNLKSLVERFELME